MNFINKNKTNFKPPDYNKFAYYNIICRYDPPKDVNLRVIHKTIVEMQNSLNFKDEQNLVNKIIINNKTKFIFFTHLNFIL